jgi:hypothetical protein
MPKVKFMDEGKEIEIQARHCVSGPGSLPGG